MAAHKTRETSAERNRLIREGNSKPIYPRSVTPLGQVDHVVARKVGDRVTSRMNAILARRADIHTH
jgi:hypothetical protein